MPDVKGGNVMACEELTAERMLSVTYDMFALHRLPITERIELYRQLFTKEDMARMSNLAACCRNSKEEVTA